MLIWNIKVRTFDYICRQNLNIYRKKIFFYEYLKTNNGINYKQFVVKAVKLILIIVLVHSQLQLILFQNKNKKTLHCNQSGYVMLFEYASFTLGMMLFINQLTTYFGMLSLMKFMNYETYNTIFGSYVQWNWLIWVNLKMFSTVCQHSFAFQTFWVSATCVILVKH